MASVIFIVSMITIVSEVTKVNIEAEVITFRKFRNLLQLIVKNTITVKSETLQRKVHVNITF